MEVLSQWVLLVGAAITFGIGASIIDHMPVGSIRWDRNKEFLIIPFIIGVTLLVVWWSYEAAREMSKKPVWSALRLLRSVFLLAGTLMLYVVLKYYEFMPFIVLFVPFGFYLSFWFMEDVYTLISPPPAPSVKQRAM